jgi:hypothetical protein
MSEPYRGYLINPKGVMIKPMNIKHMQRLMKTESQWSYDPVTGDASQTGGFRIPTQDEIDEHLGVERKGHDAMMRQEQKELRRKAPVMIMARDEEEAHEIRTGRKATRKGSK